jgi:hypothetical protein
VVRMSTGDTLLRHTQGDTTIHRWTDDEQRCVVVQSHRTDGSIEAVCVEELDELIAALQAQREWLEGESEAEEVGIDMAGTQRDRAYEAYCIARDYHKET